MSNSVDYGNTEIPSMHRRLGSATLSQLAFPRESFPNISWEKTHWDKKLLQKSRLLPRLLTQSQGSKVHNETLVYNLVPVGTGSQNESTSNTPVFGHFSEGLFRQSACVSMCMCPRVRSCVPRTSS